MKSFKILQLAVFMIALLSLTTQSSWGQTTIVLPQACNCPSATDTDGDGVPDASDLCPGTPSGTLVDADGCPIQNSSTNGTAVVSNYGDATCADPSQGTINGTLTEGVAVSGVTMSLYANVTTLGTYDLSATQNGVTFTGSGTFTALGCQLVTLTASGTPTAAGPFDWCTNTTPQGCSPATVAAVVGMITSLDNCASPTTAGTLQDGTAASGVSFTLNYSGGNGGTHSGQTVASTGVTGLTATLSAGSFATGAGVLVYNVTGTPASTGTASFAISIGGQSCTVDMTVDPSAYACPGATPTVINDVTNPTTGETWMDRNLGASQAATSSTDAASYGDLYQWGRCADGHESRTSSTFTTGFATTAVPSAGNPWDGLFIRRIAAPYDWLSPSNVNLWQGVSGVNNPCPSGYRLPTEAELNAERASWGFFDQDAAGAFASALKWSLPGYRNGNATFDNEGTVGRYWSSTASGAYGASIIIIQVDDVSLTVHNRVNGYSVRCIKN